MINKTQQEITVNWNVDNSDTPLLSIRCITYNHEKYISQALDGFLMQNTNFPFDIIIHDDASTDKTADIIREYEKKFPKIIKPIYEKENQWCKHDGSIARIVNSKLKGKYVAWCEGDDYWTDENKLQMQVDFLEKNPECYMCFHSAQIQGEDKKLKPVAMENIEERYYSATELFENWIVPTASSVFRKEVHSFPIKNEKQFLYGDIVLFEKCAHMGRVFGFNKRMSVYRIHENGVCHSKSLSQRRYLLLPEHYENLEQNFPLIDKKKLYKKIARAYISCGLHYKNIKIRFNSIKKGVSYIFKLFFLRQR